MVVGGNKVAVVTKGIEGNLADSSFFDIMREVALPKLTGILKVNTTGKRTYRFYFRKGILIYSENSKERTEKRVLKMVRNSGLITRETFVKAEKKKSKMLKSLLEILIDQGHVSMLLYSKIINTVLRINIIDVMLAAKGTYSFDERKTIREVHGIRAVDIKTVQVLSNCLDSSENRKAVSYIMKHLYSNVSENSNADYLSVDKPFIQNFLITEQDFIKYVSKAAQDFSKGAWKVQSRLRSSKNISVATLYFFRTFIFAGICAFLYLATMTNTFKVEKEHRSIKDFYFFKVSLLMSLVSFEAGDTPSAERALESGLINMNDIKHSGYKIKGAGNAKKN